MPLSGIILGLDADYKHPMACRTRFGHRDIARSTTGVHMTGPNSRLPRRTRNGAWPRPRRQRNRVRRSTTFSYFHGNTNSEQDVTFGKRAKFSKGDGLSNVASDSGNISFDNVSSFNISDSPSDNAALVADVSLTCSARVQAHMAANEELKTEQTNQGCSKVDNGGNHSHGPGRSVTLRTDREATSYQGGIRAAIQHMWERIKYLIQSPYRSETVRNDGKSELDTDVVANTAGDLDPTAE